MVINNAMSRRVLTLTPDASFGEIINFLVTNKISGAPVVNKKGKVIGIVSEKDIFGKIFPSEKVFYKDPEYYMNFDRIESGVARVKKLKARNFMSREVIFVSPDDHILKACSYFITKKIRRLPVVDNGKLVGIVTINSIYRRFLKKYIE